MLWKRKRRGAGRKEPSVQPVRYVQQEKAYPRVGAQRSEGQCHLLPYPCQPPSPYVNQTAFGLEGWKAFLFGFHLFSIPRPCKQGINISNTFILTTL